MCTSSHAIQSHKRRRTHLPIYLQSPTNLKQACRPNPKRHICFISSSPPATSWTLGLWDSAPTAAAGAPLQLLHRPLLLVRFCLSSAHCRTLTQTLSHPAVLLSYRCSCWAPALPPSTAAELVLHVLMTAHTVAADCFRLWLTHVLLLLSSCLGSSPCGGPTSHTSSSPHAS